MEVDNEGPAFSNFTPCADTINDSKSLTLSTDVVDGDSGLDSIVFFDEAEECTEDDFFNYFNDKITCINNSINTYKTIQKYESSPQHLLPAL